MFFCTWKGHPLAAKDQLTFQEISDEPLAFLRGSQNSDKTGYQVFSYNGVNRVLPVIHVDQIGTVVELIRTKRASSICAADLSQMEPELAAVPMVQNKTLSRFAIVWKKDSSLSMGAKQMLHWLTQLANGEGES